MKKNNSKNSRPTSAKRSEKNPGTIPASAFSALAKHVQVQNQLFRAMKEDKTRPPGALASLGGHADAIIKHGEEAWEEVKRFLNVEEKQFLTSIAASTFGYTGALVDIDSIVQGVADNQRTGDSVKVLHLDLRYTVRQSVNATLPTVARVMLVQAVDEDVTALDVNAYDASVYAVNGMKNWDTRKQYRVLYDHTGYIWYYSSPHGVISKHVRIRMNSHIQFQHSTTTVEKGALQLILWSDDDTNKPSFTGVAELVYVDN